MCHCEPRTFFIPATATIDKVAMRQKRREEASQVCEGWTGLLSSTDTMKTKKESETRIGCSRSSVFFLFLSPTPILYFCNSKHDKSGTVGLYRSQPGPERCWQNGSQNLWLRAKHWELQSATRNANQVQHVSLVIIIFKSTSCSPGGEEPAVGRIPG